MNTIKRIGAMCLLVSLNSVEALQSDQMQAINQKIQELASTMHDAMLASGDQDASYAQIEDSLRQHIGVRFIKDMMPSNEERPNMDDLVHLDSEKHHHKHHHAKHHKKHHKHHQDKDKQTQENTHAAAPKQQTFVAAKSPEFTSQSFSVPIDEVKAITMKVSTTFDRDVIDSVTLKSFRKVIGYDTFESILNEDRHETKDPDDHYNITVSMMVRRLPAPEAAIEISPYNGHLAASLDKGFPYDDDGDLTDSTESYKKHAPSTATQVGVLNGQNITKEGLVNLIKDTTIPVTQELVFTTQDGNEKDMFGRPVHKQELKNLINDKPAPITEKLAEIAKRRPELIQIDKLDNNKHSDDDDGDDDEEVNRGRRAAANGELVKN